MAVTGKLRVTPQKMKTEAGKFGTSANSVKNLTNNMMNIVGQLQGTWSGDAAKTFYAKLKGLQNDMNKLFKMIQEHSEDLTNMATTYETAERANQGTASSLKTDQIV